MDRKLAIQSYREEANQLRWNLNQLEVNSVEQRASDEVRKWRQNFDISSSREIERILNEIEKRKESEVSYLANELRTSLDQFKETNLNRLVELDTFISRISPDDDIQLDYVKFELDRITKKIESLHVDIVVKIVDKSMRRRSSTALTRNTLELVKVFEFQNPQASSTSSSYCSCLERLADFVRRASTAGASYYNIGVIPHQKHL
jgi:hypothetical protein